MNLSKLQNEITKYRIVFSGISLLPFAIKLDVYYLPLNKKVGEIVGYLGRINGYIEIVEPSVRIEFRDGQWKITGQGEF